jgi:RNA polymerase sigma-70 factor (ECF subfamily)
MTMTPSPQASGPCAGDDRERLARWVAEHGRAVRGFLLALVKRGDVADDLLQETFRRAWQARERYAEDGRERSYLLRIADRLAVDHARRQKRLETTVDDEAWRAVEPATRESSAERAVAIAEERQLLQGALEVLSEPQQRVLMLRFYGDMEFAEIAAAMECPLGTVLSHCHRALGKLRKQLADDVL